MPSKRQIIFLAAILLTSCAAPTQQATVIPQTSEVSETSEVLTATPTSAPTSIPTSTNTPEPALPAYGVIDPTAGERIIADGVKVPEDLSKLEIDISERYMETHIGYAEGLTIPITVAPDEEMVAGKWHIKRIGATQDVWDMLAKRFLEKMWGHYREYGQPEDKDISYEDYVALLKAGRGGVEIPVMDLASGKWEGETRTIYPTSGYVNVITMKERDELPIKWSSSSSGFVYVDENGMLWAGRNNADLGRIIPRWLDPASKDPAQDELNLAIALAGDATVFAIFPDNCLVATAPMNSCYETSGQVEAKYTYLEKGFIDKMLAWINGDRKDPQPIWIDR